jgi:Tfp pilus assembly protein PilV
VLQPLPYINRSFLDRFAKTRQTGYTLVEVMVAGILLAFSVAVITSMLHVGTDVSQGSEKRQQAATLLKSVSENFYFYPGDLAGWNTPPPDFPCAIKAGGVSDATIPCTITVTRTPVNQTVTGRNISYLRYDLTITWEGESLTDVVYASALNFNPPGT